jgi:hypothetical protein
MSKRLGSILERATTATAPQAPATPANPPEPASAQTTSAPTPTPAKVATRDVPLQVLVPEPVRRQLEIRAAEEGITKRTFILRALRQAGLDVPEDEIRDRRKP